MTSTDPSDPALRDWRRDMASSQSLEIRDDACLRFVCAVVSQHLAGSVVATDEQVGTWRIQGTAMPRVVVYLHGMESAVAMLCPLLRRAFDVPDARGTEPRETHTLANGARLTIIEADTPEDPKPGAPMVATEVDGILLVVKAPWVGLPAPDLSIGALISPNKRSTKRKPYLLDLLIQSQGLHALGTALLPRYWSLHPAYDIVRTARRDQGNAKA